MSWHFLQGLEEVSSEAICWDGKRFVPSNGPTTLAGYCLPDSEMESCRDSQSGMMSRHSMEIHGEGVLMSSQAGSRARTSAQPEKVQESTEQGRECGFTWQGSFAKCDRDSSLWRTPQCSLLEGLDVFSATWPRWGTMRNGECSAHLMKDFPPSDSAFGLLPAPCATDWKERGRIEAMAARWVDPNYGHQKRPAMFYAATFLEQMPVAFEENLMGWPTEWTDLNPLETDKFQRWQQQHFASSREG